MAAGQSSEHEWRPGDAAIACLRCGARHSFLCSGLEDHELRHLAARATRMQLKRGQTLVLEGDASTSVYNITDGDIVLSRLTADGRRQILGFLGQGDFIGLTLSDTYRFSAEALTDARLCRFDRRGIEDMVERYPQMDRQVRRMGAAAVDGLLNLVFALGRKSAEERVASFIAYESQRRGSCGAPADSFHLPMTRADIADYLGLTLETVSRIFSRLKRQQVIRLPSPADVEILDRGALTQLSEGETV